MTTAGPATTPASSSSPSSSASGAAPAELGSCTEGHITDVYTRGVDDTGVGKNADDWASVWGFDRPYTIFAITSGDRLVGSPQGGFSPGEGEIDALAIATPVPEPAEWALMLASAPSATRPGVGACSTDGPQRGDRARLPGVIAHAALKLP